MKGLKLRWKKVIIDRGQFRPVDWPLLMSYGRPWVQFFHHKPVLQYFESNEWIDVPTEIINMKEKE